MRDVNIQKTLRRSEDFPVTLVCRDGFEIGLDRFQPAAGANVDVRRHMSVVREAGLQIAKAVRRSNRAFRMRRCFHGMNIKMIRERMIGVQLQHRLKRRQNFVRAGLRLTCGRPLIPRSEVHHRFGKERADVWILGILFPNLAHSIGISAIEGAAIFRLRICITFAERIYQRVLDQ